jgi:hypothetical protein
VRVMRVKAAARVLEGYSTRGSLWCGCHPTVDIVPGHTPPPHDIPPAPTSLPVGFGAPTFLYSVRVHTCISVSVTVIFDDICAPKISIHSGIRDPAVVGFNTSPGSITCQGEEFQKSK